MDKLLNRIHNVRITHPEWSRVHHVMNSVLSFFSLFQHRIGSILFLLFRYFPYKSTIVGKKILTTHLHTTGAIFISVHSGPYPLAGNIFHRYYPDHPMIVPFFLKKNTQAFHFFHAFFQKMNIHIVSLGGAMKDIDPILKKKGSIVLCLDAVLPVKHTAPVHLFGKTIEMSTGPIYLSKKYKKPIIPFYSRQKGNEILLYVQKPIKTNGRNNKAIMKDIALSVESMILSTIDQWQATDKILLPHESQRHIPG